MSAKPFVGSGHHVRAKTNVPIIGVFKQPIPEDNKVMMDQFQKIKSQLQNKQTINDNSLLLPQT
jgi:putative N-acetylmannosamine-6-phosphate epimerase